jgi:hypothetical protein
MENVESFLKVTSHRDPRREDYTIAGVEALDLHHLYPAMAWLGEALPEQE